MNLLDLLNSMISINDNQMKINNEINENLKKIKNEIKILQKSTIIFS